MNPIDMITVSEIINVVTVNAYTGRRVKIENRAYFGLSFCKSGKITYTHGNKAFLSTPECAVILPMGASYELYNNCGGEFPLINFLCSGEKPCDEFLTIPLNHTEDYFRDYERLKGLSMLNGSRLKIMSVFYDMLERLSGEYSVRRAELNRALRYINENIENPSLTNIEVAAAAGVCESYLRKLFNEDLGVTPKKYILDMRIKRAEQLLSEDCFNITETAYKCGFASVYHFCRAFKANTGITPSQYRKYRGII